MTAWIVVESMFGNTREVADELAASLRSRLSTEVWPVEDAPREVPDDVELVVVGGPTHAFGMSRESTRADAVKRGAAAHPERGIREWLAGIGGQRPDLMATAFDTRVKVHFVPGSAARAATRRLQKLGCVVVVPPESFYVEDMEGPLRAGELARARAWGTQIIDELRRRGRLPESA